MTRARREDFRFFCAIATRWGDVDQMGHVNNAKYLTYDEQARIDYFSQRLSGKGEGRRPSFILAHIGCDYIEQLRHPSSIQYGIRVTQIGRSSLRTQGGLFVGDRCHARTESVLVWFDYAAQRTCPVPDWVRATLRDYEIVKPSE